MWILFPGTDVRGGNLVKYVKPITSVVCQTDDLIGGVSLVWTVSVVLLTCVNLNSSGWMFVVMLNFGTSIPFIEESTILEA